LPGVQRLVVILVICSVNLNRFGNYKFCSGNKLARNSNGKIDRKNGKNLVQLVESKIEELSLAIKD
jgi:hypothetical protein